MSGEKIEDKEPRCERCMKKIALKRDNYFKIETYLHGKCIKVGYMHKACNDEMEKAKREQIKNINNLTAHLPGIMKSMGIEPPEKEMEIVV